VWFITPNQISEYSGVTGTDGLLCLSVNNLLTAARRNLALLQEVWPFKFEYAKRKTWNLKFI
jgi:hypothetical protein